MHMQNLVIFYNIERKWNCDGQNDGQPKSSIAPPPLFQRQAKINGWGLAILVFFKVYIKQNILMTKYFIYKHNNTDETNYISK